MLTCLTGILMKYGRQGLDEEKSRIEPKPPSIYSHNAQTLPNTSNVTVLKAT
jgi:hypothetical protein